MRLASKVANFGGLMEAKSLKKQLWIARIDLKFKMERDKTSMVRSRHLGPLRTQRPFYPEGKRLCQVILLHPPGGIAGGDDLEISLEVHEHAQAQITTPGATKWYKCDGGNKSKQKLFLKVCSGAHLEWVPQDNIIFNGANVDNVQSVFLEKGSSFLFWDIVDLGAMSSERSFQAGCFKSRLDVFLEGDLLFAERTLIEGNSNYLKSVANLYGKKCFGLLVSVANQPINSVLWEKIKIFSAEDEFCGVSQISDMALVARWMGNCPEVGRNWFYKLWQIIRPWYSGRDAQRPRIWQT